MEWDPQDTERGSYGNEAETMDSTSAENSSCPNGRASWSTSTSTMWVLSLSVSPLKLKHSSHFIYSVILPKKMFRFSWRSFNLHNFKICMFSKCALYYLKAPWLDLIACIDHNQGICNMFWIYHIIDLFQCRTFSGNKEIRLRCIFYLKKCISLLQAREPKAIMKINTVNATFQPTKIGTAHGLQITYLKDNSTRNVFVYHEDGRVSGTERLWGGLDWK